MKLTFQNPLEKSVTKENDDISSVIDSKDRVVDNGSATARGATTTGNGDGDGNVYLVIIIIFEFRNLKIKVTLSRNGVQTVSGWSVWSTSCSRHKQRRECLRR